MSNSISHERGSERNERASERMSERSGGREQSEQSGASKRVSGASERANGRAGGSVLQSVFLAVFDHSDKVYTLFEHSLHVTPNGGEDSGIHGEFVDEGKDVSLDVGHEEVDDENGEDNEGHFRSVVRHHVSSPGTRQVQHEIH